MRLLVITFTGPDRPGIVDALSKTVSLHDANWEESRMASLAGQFAGILKVAVAVERAEALVAALQQTEGLTLIVEHGTQPQTPARMLRLELTGADRPGLVQDVARVLAAREVNIEDLTTERIEGAMSGGMIFEATADLTAPAGLDIEDLYQALEQLADDLMVEISLARFTG